MSQDIELTRYVDDEMSASDRVSFERRLEAEPDLQRRVDELRELRDLLGVRKNEAAPRPTAGFRERVLAAGLVESGGAPDPIVGFSRQLMWAATIVTVIGLAIWAGLLRNVDVGRLEASDDEIQQTIDDLDAKHRERYGDGK